MFWWRRGESNSGPTEDHREGATCVVCVLKSRFGDSHRQDSSCPAFPESRRTAEKLCGPPSHLCDASLRPGDGSLRKRRCLTKQRVRNCLRQLLFWSRINEASPSSTRSLRPSSCCRNLSSPIRWSLVFRS